MDGRHGEEKCSNLGHEQQAEHDGGNAMDTALDQLAAILADEFQRLNTQEGVGPTELVTYFEEQARRERALQS